jgi:hypothetical protein
MLLVLINSKSLMPAITANDQGLAQAGHSLLCLPGTAAE